jgi:predicted RNA binding protein YcfA (HicA-like mRNA interferase family)
LKLRNEDGNTVVAPLHRELARGTLGSILRQSGLSAEELIDLLER